MKRVGVLVIGAVALLAACGSSGPKTAVSDATTVATATATTPTTASATAAPVVTVIVTVEVTAAATEAPATTIPLPTAAPLPPATTMAKPKSTTTNVPKTTTAATAPATTTAALYKAVDPPALPKDHTSEVPAAGDLPNGVYWAVYSGGEKLTPTVDIREAYFGDACVTKATEDGATCEDDIYIPDTPDREMSLTLAGNVKLTVSDATSQKSYQITPDELVRIRASSPSAGAPNNFSFTPFAFLATVSGAKVTKFEQVWTP